LGYIIFFLEFFLIYKIVLMNLFSIKISLK